MEEPWQDSCVLVHVSGVPARVTGMMAARATAVVFEREGMMKASMKCCVEVMASYE